jgi:hypothetical protein
MYSKKITVVEHKKNKRHRQIINRKNKLLIIKKETNLLVNIKRILPEEIVDHIYSFVSNDIKLNVSHYKTILFKYIFDFNINKNKIPIIFKDYSNFNYCTYHTTTALLQNMLYKIPLKILVRYLHYGTPSKYFNIAFPEEPNINDYILFNYTFNHKLNIEKNSGYKNMIFEIIDIISYFSTKANEWHALRNSNIKNKYFTTLNSMNEIHNYDEFCKQTEEKCLMYENITKKLMLSILYIYQKYAIQS